ncbi:hypothetical protein AVEN_4670-1 [Araneus ventricosus]|uniref:RNase H type-1 domain-containing protein n=1 Tax=Araneus ventricosus TaxID=182803 RepID=A0A4Y2I1D3_ARAVE|nr:hypothetical protein AVEN_4670-1 [Araneus ventricosus]
MVRNELRLLQGDIKNFKEERQSLLLQIQEKNKNVDNLKSINNSLVKTNSYYDRNKSGKVSLRKGDIVAVRRKPNTTGESTKTQPRYRGPMVVTEVRSGDTYRISQLEPRKGRPYTTIVHVSQLKVWRSWNEDDDDSSTNSHNEPEMQRSKRTVRKPLRYEDFMPDSYNSVFQAELEAIHFACNWALQNNYKINIHTDSLSSILAIQSANSRSEFVYSVKQDIFKARHLVGLSWVKAHVGIPGNEWADQQAKSAINLGIERLIPAPRSFLRRALKQQILNEWNEYFMNYNSASGARARDFIDKVDFNFLITNKFLIFFLCGHGPFPFNLNRFKLLDSPSCICGEVGDADHYVFSCSLTKDLHLSRPADAHKKAWFRNTMHNRQAVTKISEAFRISAGIYDSLTRDGSS